MIIKKLVFLFVAEGSPGPAYFINPKITRTGTDGTPCYSMLARRLDLGNYISNLTRGPDGPEALT